MTTTRLYQGRAGKHYGNTRSIQYVGYGRRPCLQSTTLGLSAVSLQRHVGQHHFICSIAKRVVALRSVLPGQLSGTTTQEVKALPTVKVRLCIQHKVPFGQVLKVVGAGPQFGDWQPSEGRELQWKEGHTWVVNLILDPGTYELKCVIASGNNILAWEEGANRILQVPDGVKGIRVDGTWSQTAGNRVTVTEPIAAASKAARQKRAAAARLLYKALAEVNAAVARAEAAGVVSSRRQPLATVPPATATDSPTSAAQVPNKALSDNSPAARPLSNELGNSDIPNSGSGVGPSSQAAAASDEQQQEQDKPESGVVGRAISRTAGNSPTATNPVVGTHGQGDFPESSSTQVLIPSSISAAPVSASRSRSGKELPRGPAVSAHSAPHEAQAAAPRGPVTDTPHRAPKVNQLKGKESRKQQQQRLRIELQDALDSIGRSIQQAAAAPGKEPSLASPGSASASAIPNIADGVARSSEAVHAQPPAAAASGPTVVAGTGKQAPVAAPASLGSVVTQSTAEKPGLPGTAVVASGPAPSAADGRGRALRVPVSGNGAPASSSQEAPGGPPGAVSKGATLVTQLRGSDGRIQKREGRQDAAPGSQRKGAANPKPAIQSTSKEDATSTTAGTHGSGGVSAVGGSSSASDSTSRRLSWRQAAEQEEENAGAKPAPVAKVSGPTHKHQPEELKPPSSKKQPQVSPAAQAVPGSEGVSSRFARLLDTKLGVRLWSGEQKGNEQKDVAPLQDSPATPSVASQKANGAASAARERPPTPDVQDSRSLYAASVSSPSGSPTDGPSPETSTPSTSRAVGDHEGEASNTMGVAGSRPAADSNLPQCTVGADLHRLLDVWDTAWSMGGGRQGQAGTAPAAGSRPPLVNLQANGAFASADGYQRQSAVSSGEGSTTGSAQSHSSLTDLPLSNPEAVAAAAHGMENGGPAAAEGGATSRPSSGESLYSRAERLTANGGSSINTLGESSSGDTSQDGITVRKGAMAAMGVDRQGSVDHRSSYLSQSLLAQEASLGGSGSNAMEPSSSALLRQLRAVNEANAAAASTSNGLDGNPVGAPKGTQVNAAKGGPFPPLPSTPAPNGILTNVHNEDEDEQVAPPLPATPPPPSYLSGGSAAAPVVPPLPATPVPKSVLSGLKGGVQVAAEDLLLRVTDSDAVLDMLRGNLPLTPIARGGRGGAVGPLSLVEDDGEEEQGGGSGNARKRRLSRGTNGGRSGQGQSNGMQPRPQADPATAAPAALAGAAQAWDNTRAALQQGASGLGLSRDVLSESASRLLQQLPKIDVPQQPSSPALPPAVTRIARSLGWGLGATGAAGGPQGRQAGEGSTGSTAGGGSTTANGAGAGVEGATGSTAPGGQGAPSGSLRLVAGAHMIPHVDKVDKGGEDAYFISRVGLGGVAVADGVSGWADEGIDPAEYPRTLMRFATEAYEAARGTMSSQDIIRYAQFRTYLKGSSTVCMALMKPGRKLEIANVGDSGVRILRGGKIIFGTEAQQHSFNMPYQLSHPNNVEDPDSADDADVHLLDVQEGDVVMLATDGLFDNVFDEEIEHIVSQQLKELAAAGRGKPPPASTSASETAPANSAISAASVGSTSSTSGQGGSRSGGAGGGGGRGLLSQSLNAAANGAGRGAGGQYRAEDAARVARALAERAHQHARNPTQRTPWSVTSSQQPNFMWAKFFAKGGGKMDDCTVLVAFVCGPE